MRFALGDRGRHLAIMAQNLCAQRRTQRVFVPPRVHRTHLKSSERSCPGEGLNQRENPFFRVISVFIAASFGRLDNEHREVVMFTEGGNVMGSARPGERLDRLGMEGTVTDASATQYPHKALTAVRQMFTGAGPKREGAWNSPIDFS